MSLCGELEISQDEMARAIKSVIRSAAASPSINKVKTASAIGAGGPY